MKKINYIYYLILIVFTASILSVGSMQAYRVSVMKKNEISQNNDMGAKMSKNIELSKKITQVYSYIKHYFKLNYIVSGLLVIFYLLNLKVGDSSSRQRLVVASFVALILMLLSLWLATFGKSWVLAMNPVLHLIKEYTVTFFVVLVLHLIMGRKKIA